MLPVYPPLVCVTFRRDLPHFSRAQDLAPRDYFIGPLRSNAVTLSESFFDGSIDYNGVIPISNATGIFTYDQAQAYFAYRITEGKGASLAYTRNAVSRSQYTQESKEYGGDGTPSRAKAQAERLKRLLTLKNHRFNISGKFRKTPWHKRTLSPAFIFKQRI
jgi:hypothetical protein